MTDENKSSSGRSSRRGGRRRYFRAKGEGANAANEKPESGKLGGRTGAKRTSAQRGNAQKSNEPRNAEQREPRSGEAKGNDPRNAEPRNQRRGQRDRGQRAAAVEPRTRSAEMDVRRSRRRRRRRGERSDTVESRNESVIVSSALDYSAPQSVFVYTYVSRGDTSERYESKVEHFSSIGRKIEDYGIDLSNLIAEDGTIHLPKMDARIADWEDEPAEMNAVNQTERTDSQKTTE